MLIKKALILATALVALTGSAFAQKVAMVDMQRASQSYWKLNDIKQRLTADQARLADLAQNTQSNIEALAQEHEAVSQDAQNAALSPERQAEAQARATEIERQVTSQRTVVEEARRRLQTQAQAYERGVLEDIKAAVKTVAQRRGIDAVYTTETVLYAGIDLTDDVIRELNATAPKAAEAPAAPAPAPAPAAAPAPAPAAR